MFGVMCACMIGPYLRWLKVVKGFHARDTGTEVRALDEAGDVYFIIFPLV